MKCSAQLVSLKKRLYHHFPAKQELVFAVLEQRAIDWLDWMTKRLSEVEQGAAALEAFFLALHDWFAGEVAQLHSFHGCFFTKVALEVQDQAVQARCQQFRLDLAALLAPHLQIMLATGATGQCEARAAPAAKRRRRNRGRLKRRSHCCNAGIVAVETGGPAPSLVFLPFQAGFCHDFRADFFNRQRGRI